MGLVDAAMVSRLGEAELAGVGLGAVVTLGIMGFAFGLLRAVKVLLAQARGAGQLDAARAYVGAGLMIAVWLGLLMAAFAQGMASLAANHASSARAAEAAHTYIAIRSLGAPVIIAYAALREARFGYGDMRSPLIASVIGNLLHACMDYVAIFMLDLGVAGAALANIGSFGIQLSILIYVQREQGLSLGRAEWHAQKRVLEVGSFTGFQWLLEIGSLLLLSLFLAGTSDRDMAAHQIGVQVTAFSFLPAFAVAEAATVLVAQSVGRGRFHLVPLVARETVKLAVSYALFCGCVFILLGPQIVKAFGTDTGLHHVARLVLVAVALQQVFDASTTVGHCVLRGAGAQRRSLLVAILCAWGVTPGLGFLLARRLHWGAPGAWVAMALEMVAASMLVWWHINHLGWVNAARRAYRAGRVHGHAHA